jgi:hypothetical protein
MKQKLGITAVVFIILGFGMIHGSAKYSEITGGSLIGIGSLYLLYLLYTSGRNNK